MRNTLPLLSRTPAASDRARSPTPAFTTPSQPMIPTIRLTHATPVTGTPSADASSQTILAPKAQAESRKRLVPKKSKLSLLTSVGSKRGGKEKDLSDVARRVGVASSTGRSFDIYVDPTDDPDIGEIVVVKKKRSRAGLDGLRWGTLGDVTNTVKVVEKEDGKKGEGKGKDEKKKTVTASLKIKSDEKEKWWTIGRGRRDSKDRAKEKAKEKQKFQEPANTGSTPSEKVQANDPRQRAHSFDSGIILNTPTALTTAIETKPLPAEPSTRPSLVKKASTLFGSRPSTPISSMLLAPPSADKDKQQSGSIAQRAMRSVRSIAHMKSWAQLRGSSSDGSEAPPDERRRSEKGREKKEKKEKVLSIRSSSGSSFEAGRITPVKSGISFGTFRRNSDPPSTMRSISSQNTGASCSSSGHGHGPQSNANRLSVESVTSSMQSLSSGTRGSSISPILAGSRRNLKRSSGSSVRWDDQVDTVKDRRPISNEFSASTDAGEKKPRESRRSAEGRRRPALAALFPGTGLDRHTEEAPRSQQWARPTLTLEVASPDRDLDFAASLLEVSSVESAGTPVKKARPRPVSEQMLGRIRPRGIVGDEAEGVMSILDAATSELAYLIDRLDLEATPDTSPLRGTPGVTQTVRSRLNSGPNSSPVKRAIKALSSEASINSLRPYEYASLNSSSANRLGQQIAPWTAFSEMETVDDVKVRLSSQPSEGVPAFSLKHKRTLSPPLPAYEPLTFHPLPASKTQARPTSKLPPRSKGSSDYPRAEMPEGPSVVTSSSMTFGVRPYKVTTGSAGSAAPSPTTTGGKHSQEHGRERSSLVPLDVDKPSNMSGHMNSKARRALGMRGTMGSVGSLRALDTENPDSDIPGELQVILNNSNHVSMYSVDMMASHADNCSSAPSLPPSPGFPLNIPLPPLEQGGQAELLVAPVFRATVIDDEDNEAEIEETESSDDETKKSFDFTGELQKLNESGASDRRSFVMQLENAFKTPAKIDIKSLGAQLILGEDHLRPEVPPLPAWAATTSNLDFSQKSLVIPDSSIEDSIMSADSIAPENSGSHVLTQRIKQGTLTIDSTKPYLRTVPSKASDGQLNREFKFGGNPQQAGRPSDSPVTLSDIIPPPSHHTRNQSSVSRLVEDASVLKSILAMATKLSDPVIESERPRINSDSSSKRRARQEALSQLTAHARHNSDASEFSGMSSFSEVRRGFEFGANRPAFYPPPGATANFSQTSHGRYDSLFSIASVSSYGAIVKPGSPDPFDYGLPSRPVSSDTSVTIDDTFSFLHHDPRRKRVDSDASSFYFNPSREKAHIQRRHRRQNDSMASVISGPPISLYNRSYSYAAHRRNDSSTSASSLAHAYGSLGANGGRAAWAKHQRDVSVDSTGSGFSAQRLGRPGLSDKMFESAQGYGMPLSAISASPQSESSRGLADRTSFDSIMDDDRRSSINDSLFDETGQPAFLFSESVFGNDVHHPLPQRPGLLPPNHFRPLSMLSVNSNQSSKREDDTMITMFDGGHVRRRSIGSVFEASPCVRAEKRMHGSCLGNRIRTRTPSDSDYVDAASPNEARIIERPSLTSSLAEQFGDNRMNLARRGLLERQSLEDSCLSGEGEDTSTSVIAHGVFRRPDETSRSDHGSYMSASSGADTPPLSISDGSSLSSGSQSSIDLSRLNVLLTNARSPSGNPGGARVRARARGHGHRRGVSQARASRSSVYETIEEEIPGSTNSPAKIRTVESSKQFRNVQVTVAPASRYSQETDVEIVQWDEDDVGPALRKYYALKDEAHETVVTSRRLWEDTPFSIFAIQSFDPPRHPAGMQALLEHSQKTYGPLPSELRVMRRRSRTLSRPSPYPRSRKVSELSEPCPPMNSSIPNFSVPSISMQAVDSLPLRDVLVNANITNNLSPVPALNPLKPFTPFAVSFKERSQPASVLKGDARHGLPVPSARPRVPSNARRNALGWSKRSMGRSTHDNKENATYGALMSPSESLRIVRPRPKGRPTPTARTIRV